MVEIKEIKSVDLASYTLMSSSIHAIFAFIFALLIVLIFGTIATLIPGLSTFSAFIGVLGISIIILYPLSAFFINILVAFVMAGLYNLVASVIGGVKLGLEGEEIKSFPVIAFALIMSCISAIIALIIGLYMALAFTPITSFISAIIPVIAGGAANITNNTTIITSAIPISSAVSMGGIIFALSMIILLPILVFIFSFIGNAIFALAYNLLIPKVGGIQLKLEAVSDMHRINNIPVLPATIALSVVSIIFGLLQGLTYLAQYSMLGDVTGGILSLIFNIIATFIATFIIVALATLFYNVLAPSIGGVKIELN